MFWLTQINLVWLQRFIFISSPSPLPPLHRVRVSIMAKSKFQSINSNESSPRMDGIRNFLPSRTLSGNFLPNSISFVEQQRRAFVSCSICVTSFALSSWQNQLRRCRYMRAYERKQPSDSWKYINLFIINFHFHMYVERANDGDDATLW
jgi:uncharacterized BrkB/YihY/UPF0761 family membrane protein